MYRLTLASLLVAAGCQPAAAPTTSSAAAPAAPTATLHASATVSASPSASAVATTAPDVPSVPPKLSIAVAELTKKGDYFLPPNAWVKEHPEWMTPFAQLEVCSLGEGWRLQENGELWRVYEVQFMHGGGGHTEVVSDESLAAALEKLGLKREAETREMYLTGLVTADGKDWIGFNQHDLEVRSVQSNANLRQQTAALIAASPLPHSVGRIHELFGEHTTEAFYQSTVGSHENFTVVYQTELEDGPRDKLGELIPDDSPGESWFATVDGWDLFAREVSQAAAINPTITIEAERGEKAGSYPCLY